MSYLVRTIAHFDNELRRLVKKYASLKNEFQELVRELADNPEKGMPLGNNIYKIRLGITSKGKGKRGGARVITYLKTERKEVYLLSIYDKSNKNMVSDKEIRAIMNAEEFE
ncbi:MAG: type II toxin-antitoxin system RelE/ParE family toxin [Bacteroidetes bacterium]|nr:type II toxin-antitoxin system RelE/ParE family toxin [Bacteroidota bacterium]